MTSGDGGADGRAEATVGQLWRTAGSRRGSSTSRRGAHVERGVLPYLRTGDVRRDRLAAGSLARHCVLRPPGDSGRHGRVFVSSVGPVRYAAVTPAGPTEAHRAVPGHEPVING